MPELSPVLVGLSWLALAVGFACATWILLEMFWLGRRPRMTIMMVVWPITALYLGPIAVWGFRRWGHGSRDRPRWARYAIGVSHCGAGCTLGDIIGEWLVFTLAVVVFGTALYAEFIVDFVLALVIGLAFQYFAIVPMRGLGFRAGVAAATKADIASLTAYEIGLFGWMALVFLVIFPDPHLLPSSPVYWLSMQIGMITGFLTAYPVNVWLIRRGIKEVM